MDEREIWRRYALALALVDDPDVAGDLFMRASGEADLLRRVARWRSAQGLEPLPAPAELPALDEFQAAHALHLYRRGEGIRRTWRLLRVLVPALTVLALLAGLLAIPRGPAAAPAYRRPPLRSMLLPGELRVTLYLARVSPGEITLWWDVKGAAADRAGRELVPTLTLQGADRTWAPSAQHWTRVSESRLLGEATYRLYVTHAATATLRFPDPGQWVVEVPLEGEGLPPEGVAIPLDRPVVGGRYPVHLDSLVLTPRHTAVRYRATAPEYGEPTSPGDLQVGAFRLIPLSRATPVDEAGLLEVRYEALPYGADQVTLTWRPQAEVLGPVVYFLPNPEILSPFTRLGDRIQALYRAEQNYQPRVGPDSLPFFTDRSGRRYEVQAVPPQAWGGVIQYSMVVLDPPEELDFVTLTIPELELYHRLPPTQIDLFRP